MFFLPPSQKSEPVLSRQATPTKELRAVDRIKIMTWNVQYMASKNYCFFYDVLGGTGPHIRPSAADIAVTLNEVARVINDEDADIVLLQELDVGAKRTDYQDQVTLLLEKLKPDYRHYATTYYWKAPFVPHPKIWGSVGMKLLTISKYPIKSAHRYQLPTIPHNPLTRLFYLKRAVLECTIDLPTQDGSREFLAFNTHLDAFAQGTDTLERQVTRVTEILKNVSSKPWVIGGDFNLLPPTDCRAKLQEHQQPHYRQASEIMPLYENFGAIPSIAEISGTDCQKWFTHFPNDPRVGRPDRTIDYLFYSKKCRAVASYVRSGDTQKISDHFPVVGYFTDLPERS